MVKSNKRRISTKGKTTKNQYDFSREKSNRQDSANWKKLKNTLEKY